MALPPAARIVVVELLEATDGAGQGDDMRPLGSDGARHRMTDAARGAGDEGDATGQPPGHGQPASASSDSWRGLRVAA